MRTSYSTGEGLSPLTKIFLGVVAVPVVIGGVVGAYAGIKTVGHGIDYSDGDRAGTVTKISNKGIFCKSWEGQLAMDNFRAGQDGKGTTNSFDFSVTDQKIVTELQQDMANGTRVTLHYKQSATTPFCGEKTTYTITDVTPAVKN
jgi:hypothetical protein